MKEKSIQQYSTNSKLKCFLVERYIRKFKSVLYKLFTENGNHKWFDHLNDITKNLNDSYHRSLQMSPSQVSKKNEDLVLNNLYSNLAEQGVKKPRFSVGDFVRISKEKLLFEKSATQSWTDEIFEINAVNLTIPVPVYTLKTRGTNELLEGKYYEEELQKIPKF